MLLLRRIAAGSSRAAAARAPCTAAMRHVSGLAVPGTPRTLDDVSKVELFEAEEPARISAIWEAFHETKDAVAGACVDPAEHASMAERASESPMFVFPIRREGGHFMLLSQYAAAHRMFVMTSLEEYQRSAAMAQPWASVHLFDELLATKAVGLLRAEVVPERLTTAEAEHLLLLTRRYYGTASYDKVWMFNHAEKHFDLDGYLASCP
jgi:ATP synthase F1 complex assembly factor 1